MRITAVNTTNYQQNVRISKPMARDNKQQYTNLQTQLSFKSDAGALKGAAIGAGLGLLAAAAIVLTGGAAAIGVPAIGIFGAGAGAGAQVGGITGGLTSGKE